MLAGLGGRLLEDHATAGRVGRRVGLEDGVDPAAVQPGQQASQELLVEPADQLGGPAGQLLEGAVAQQELGRGADGRIAAGAQQLDDREGAFGADPAKAPLGPDPLAQRYPALPGELLGGVPGGAGWPVGHDGLGEHVAEEVVAALGNAEGDLGGGAPVGLGGAAGAGPPWMTVRLGWVVGSLLGSRA